MWPFTRKPKPINPGPINEDWCVGDLAECIRGPGDSWSGDGLGPEGGDVCKVTHVKVALGGVTKKHGWYLTLRGFPGNFNSNEFRKVPPLNSEASAEFTAQIRRCKPAHSPAPVA